MILDVACVLRGTEARVLRLGSDGSATEGNLRPSDLVRAFTGVSIDSRAVSDGHLFVALPGTRADGHDYVDAAFRSGAHGAIVARPLSPNLRTGDSPRYLFVVRDPLTALQSLATYWRTQCRARVVGITGSIGKTTTKEIIASTLSARWPVLRSEANFNTEIGLPLMLLRLGSRHHAGVFEMGMHARGDIEQLAAIAQPHTGVVTTVAPVHLERMGTIDAIAREKSKLIQALPPDGLAVLNADDPWTRAMAMTSGTAPSVLAGLSDDADYRAVDIVTHGLDGVSFTLRAEGESRPVRTQVPGVHTVQAFLAAAAVARSLDMPWPDVVDALEAVRIESRQRVVELHPNVVLIDDAYNAAPLSMCAALDVLASAQGTRVAVLGDMLELGPLQEESHREVGRRAAGIADVLIVRGERATWIADEAEREGLPSERIFRAGSNAEAAMLVRAAIRSTEVALAGPPTMQHRTDAAAHGFTILVKGSRGMRMEEIVRELQGEGL